MQKYNVESSSATKIEQSEFWTIIFITFRRTDDSVQMFRIVNIEWFLLFLRFWSLLFFLQDKRPQLRFRLQCCVTELNIGILLFGKEEQAFISFFVCRVFAYHFCCHRRLQEVEKVNPTKDWNENVLFFAVSSLQFDGVRWVRARKCKNHYSCGRFFHQFTVFRLWRLFGSSWMNGKEIWFSFLCTERRIRECKHLFLLKFNYWNCGCETSNQN